jgi:uncharacterized protein YbjT (DUF2867 family)
METKKMHEYIKTQTAGKRILLIGSSGNIGGKALKLLIEHGSAESITAFDKNPPKEKNLPGNVVVISGAQGDITSQDAVFTAVKGNDTVVCAIGVPRVTAPEEKKLTPFEIEENGIKYIVQAAVSDGSVKHIIYISALGVARGDKIPSFHLNHLAKRNAENILLQSNIAYTILRPSGYFFDFRDLLAAAISDRYKIVDQGSGRVQPVSQDNMAEILCASIGNERAKNMIVGVGGPDVFSYRGLAEVFGRVLKKEVKPVSLSPALFKKEYFNSDVVLFRATSDSVLAEGDMEKQQELYPCLELTRLEDYLNNPDDPMLKAYFKK